MSLKNLISRIHNKLAIEADAFLWHRSLTKIRSTLPPKEKGKVLICNLMTMIATAKIEALFAATLRQKGYRSIVLLEGPAPFIEKLYASACPDVEFVYYSDLSKKIDTSFTDQQVNEILAEVKDNKDILTLEYNGCRIGKNALSLAVRQLRIGSLELSNPTHLNNLKNILKKSLEASLIAKDFIKNLKPDAALFIERGYTPAGEFFDQCINQNIRTTQWLGAPQEDKLLLKGYSKRNRANHPLSLSNETWDKLSVDSSWTIKQKDTVIGRLTSHYSSGAWFNRQQLQKNKSIKSSDEVIRSLKLDPNKKTAVIFSHIFYDATFFYGESLYPDYKRWLVETVRYAIQNTNVNWIVKVHPVNVWRSEMDGAVMEQLEREALKREFGKLPSHIKILPADTDINTFSLFSFIDYGLTVRGTIGMELPCFGIPVVTAGTGRYSGRGFTIDPEDITAYKKTLLNLHNEPKLSDDKIDLACRHAYGTFFLRPVPMETYKIDFHANRFYSKALIQNSYINKNSTLTDLNYPDLNLVIDWIVNSASEDLLNDTTHSF